MEQLNAIIFYIISAIIIFSSIAVIFTKKIMKSVFFALVTFICFGLLFFFLNALFNGVIQISIYGIALCILFAIAVMLTNNNEEETHKIKFSATIILAFLGVIMILSSILIFLKETMMYDSVFKTYINSSHILTSLDNTKQLSSELLTHNLYSFELLGLYLLIVLIGILVLLTFKGESK